MENFKMIISSETLDGKHVLEILYEEGCVWSGAEDETRLDRFPFEALCVEDDKILRWSDISSDALMSTYTNRLLPELTFEKFMKKYYNPDVNILSYHNAHFSPKNITIEFQRLIDDMKLLLKYSEDHINDEWTHEQMIENFLNSEGKND